MACVKNFNSSQNKWRMDLLFPYLSVVGFGFGFCWAYLCGVRVLLTVPFLSGYFSLWHSDFNCIYRISFIFSFLNWKALLLPKHTLLNHHYSAVNCFPPFSVLFTLYTNTDSRTLCLVMLVVLIIVLIVWYFLPSDFVPQQQVKANTKRKTKITERKERSNWIKKEGCARDNQFYVEKSLFRLLCDTVMCNAVCAVLYAVLYVSIVRQNIHIKS